MTPALFYFHLREETQMAEAAVLPSALHRRVQLHTPVGADAHHWLLAPNEPCFMHGIHRDQCASYCRLHNGWRCMICQFERRLDPSALGGVCYCYHTVGGQSVWSTVVQACTQVPGIHYVPCAEPVYICGGCGAQVISEQAICSRRCTAERLVIPILRSRM